MMNLDGQDIAALVLVALAGFYLAYKAWGILTRKHSGCGSCSQCPTEEDDIKTAGEKQMVPVDSLVEAARASARGSLPAPDSARADKLPMAPDL